MTVGNLNGFNANNVEPVSFDVLPAGVYDVVIVSSEVEATKAGDGKFLHLKMQVLSGPYQNRKLFDRLNLWNPSSQAVQIAQGTLSSICRAVGIMTPNDSSDLHNKPLRCKVIVKKSPEFGESNEVKAYYPRNAGPASPAQPAGADPNASSLPWPAPPSTAEQAASRF